MVRGIQDQIIVALKKLHEYISGISHHKQQQKSMRPRYW